MNDAAIQSLPDDPVLLKALLGEGNELLALREKRIAENEQRLAEKDQRLAENDQRLVERDTRIAELELDKLRLQQQLLVAMKRFYGPRGDRLNSNGDVAQLLLEFATDLQARPVNPADLPPDVDASTIDPSTIREVKRKGRKGRRDLGAEEFNHLPSIRKEHDLTEGDKPCSCCNQPRTKIGEESTWQIEYMPGYFIRIEHVQIKYGCPHCEQQGLNPNIELADKPIQPIEKGMAGPGLLAYIATAKYADYLPLYRLENIFARSGFEIDRTTQCIWCRDVAEIIMPVYELMTQRMLDSHLIATDDTVMPMLAPGKTKQARMWIYYGDDDHPYNIFDFTLNRGRDGPALFLKGYNQTIIADAYGGYDGICVEGGITQAGCWAHARRKFVDSRDLSPKIVDSALLSIGKLFAIEKQIKDDSPETRLEVRQSQSKPIIEQLFESVEPADGVPERSRRADPQ